jgi:hypothetical protein
VSIRNVGRGVASLVIHQPAVLFSHNKSVTSTFFSEQISISKHQPSATSQTNRSVVYTKKKKELICNLKPV